MVPFVKKFSHLVYQPSLFWFPLKIHKMLFYRTIAARNEFDQSSHTDDTHNLIAAVWYGKNLRPEQPIGGMMHASRQQALLQQQQLQQQQQQQMAKAPSAIKTNIKAGLQVHPYQRS